MKLSNLSKVIGASVIAVSAAVSFNLPASAQTDTAPRTTDTVPRQETYNTTRNDDFDWGWLGLLGLGGLAGLAGRKRPETVAYRDPNDVRSTTYR
jgi:MYXO-CTERM domain-containing protein